MNRPNILTILREAQRKNGYLTKKELLRVSRENKIPLNQVYSVATFYSFFSRKRSGKYVIKICKSIPCHMKGAWHAAEVITDKLGIYPGKTSHDKKFSLKLVNCIGACDKAPAMFINDKFYPNLTKEKIEEIIEELKEG